MNRSWRTVLAGAVVFVLGACGVEEKEEAFNPSGNQPQDGHNMAQMQTAPASGETRIDASDPQKWTYFDFSSGGVASVADGKVSMDWDLAFRRAQIAANGGTSGSGQASALATSETDLAAVTMALGGDHQMDKMMPIPGPPGSGEYSGNPAMAEWFNYDPTTHAVSSKGLVYCVQTADGKHGKMRIKGYSGGQYVIEWGLFPEGATPSK